MSYKSNQYIPTKLDIGLNFYHNATANMSSSSGITFASQDTEFGQTFSLSKSSSYFTLPEDGVYMLEGSLCAVMNNPIDVSDWANTYVVYQWYDLTNNKYVGNKAVINAGYTILEGRGAGVICDEIARFVTDQNINVELRILSHGDEVDEIDGDGLQPTYSGRARCLVYKF